MSVDRKLPNPPPVPAGDFYGEFVRPFHSLDRDDPGPIQVKINDKEVKDGELSAIAIALLGVDKAQLDRAWRGFVNELGMPQITGVVGGGVDEWAVRNQQGAQWRMEAWVSAGKGVTEVRDLAYVDQRDVRRRVSFTVRQWDELTYKRLAENNFDPSVDRHTWLTTVSRDPEDAGAVAAWLSGVDQNEVADTLRAAAALEAARRDLELARDAMAEAIRIADAAWTGNRADAAKGKFCMEYDIADAIAQAVHYWEDFTQDVVRCQRKAIEEDQKLIREVLIEFTMLAAIGVLTGGLATALRAGKTAERIIAWGRRIERLQNFLSEKNMVRATQVVEQVNKIKGLRILARGAGDATALTAVRTVRGEPMTFTDYVICFGLAGVWGQYTSDWAGRFNISFTSDAARGGAKGAVQGLPRAVASDLATDASLGRIAVGYGVGIPGEAAKEATRQNLRRTLLEAAKADPEAMAAARARVLEDLRARYGRHSPEYRAMADDPAALDKAAVKRLEKEVDLELNPIMDFAFTGATRSAGEATNDIRKGNTDVAPTQPYSDGSGLVRQPTGGPGMPTGAGIAGP